MPARPGWIINAAAMVLLILSACSIGEESNAPGSEGTSTSTAATGQDQATDEPTPIPSGSFLRIDGVNVQQVVLWDEELPAEYAATSFTLYHRSDARNWTRVANLPIQGEIIADPADPERLYIGDHPPCLSRGEPIPFHRSTDGGRTWKPLSEATNVRPIMVWSSDSDVLIGSRCGLAVSMDGGHSWERHLPESEFDVSRLTATPIGLFGVFTTAEREISHLRRIDLDDPANPEFDPAILSFWGTGAVHASEERIVVGEPAGVHFSDDGGETWTFTREGLEDVVTSVNPLEESVPEAEIDRGIGIFAVLPHPEDSARIFLGTIRGLYLSEDGGETWGKVPEIEDREVRQLEFSMDGAILYVTTTEGVMILHNP